MFKKIEHQWREVKFEIDSFRNQSYPDFVTADSPKPIKNEVPLFTFHTIQPQSFEEQLQFLAANGYQTIAGDEFLAFLAGGKPVPERAVLLTIDDGLSSVWTYGYPLLKKYGFKAVVFLIPGYIKEEQLGYNLDDYWAGACKLKEVRPHDESHNPLLAWNQIREMHRSSVIDFQSHTLYHHKVYTAPRLVDFYNPGNATKLYDLVLPKDFEGELLNADHANGLYGMPIYENDSLMAAKPRYLGNAVLAYRCMEHVRENGARQFFQKKLWRRELLQMVNEAHSFPKATPAFQTPEELRREIFHNLRQSKRFIEERLSGKTVRHLCYPYGLGSEASVELSRDAGYATNFWCVLNGRRSNHAGDDPFYCVRVKNDYIFRLPGKGRKSLPAIFKEKLARRVKGEPIY